MFNSVDTEIFNEFLNSNTDVKTVESSFDYNSFYRAYVESTDDPEHLGRIKIRIPMLQDKNVNKNVLQWAYPAIQSGLGYQTGSFILPPVGSIVFVTFEYSDEHRPIYFGGIPTQYAEGKEQSYGILVNNGESKTVEGDDLPTEYTGSQAIVYKSPTGSVIYVDDNDENRKVVMKDSEGKAVLLVDATDAETGETKSFIQLKYDKDNYVKLEKDEFHLVIKGQEVDIENDEASTILWDDEGARTYLWDYDGPTITGMGESRVIIYS